MESGLPSDQDLVARCRADRSAWHGSFRDLYQRHAGRAYRFLTAMVGDERAKDCLQETCLRVYRQLDRYDPARPFAPWLLGVARNVALDALRRESRRPAEPLPAEERVPADDEAAEQVAERREVGELIHTAVEKLPANEREVFLLKQVEGLTFAQVADAVGCSLRTAKYRMRAAVDALAADLRQAGVVGGGS